ncbi:MAG: cob(I)yrinic acid a,c-diamide adenosyltransferase [Thermoplasmata archaeon]|nr:cob(I)yrinic acid a,c-diamide adenosyltransferase [Thermoplasmata archaeon]
MKGKVLVFTGDGKGKTTAAIGTGCRAHGHGKKVFMVQFLKKGEYGEIKAIPFPVYQFGREEFVIKPSEEDYKLAREGMDFARELIKKEKPFLLILDELNVAISMGLVNIDDAMRLIEERGETNLIITGRNAHERIINAADLVTEMRNVKHYFDSGTNAIEGLEY